MGASRDNCDDEGGDERAHERRSYAARLRRLRGGTCCARRRDRRRRKHIGAHRPGDVLERLLAEIDECVLQLVADLPVCVLGEAKPARLANPLEPRGNVDAVAHEIAVGLLDHVAEVDADAELDAALGRQAGVALGHAVLHFDGAAHGVDHAAELDENAVAGAFDDAPVVRVDGGIDQVAAQPPEPRQGAILVRSREPAVADDIRNQDRRNLADFGHGAPSRVMQNSTRKA